MNDEAWEEFISALGLFVSEHAALEFELTKLLDELTGKPDPDLFLITAISRQTFDQKVELFRAFVKLRPGNQFDAGELNSLCNDLKHANTRRNRIVHDSWIHGDDGSLRRVNVLFRKGFYVEDKQESPGDIVSSAGDVLSLNQRLVEWVTQLLGGLRSQSD